MPATYEELILEAGPDLYWPMRDSAAGTTVADASGNGRDGKKYSNQAVSAAKVTTGFWDSLVRPRGETDYSAFINGDWNDPPTVQSAPGSGIRADDYSPWQPGCILTMECWMTKTEEESFATVFSSGGTASGAPGATNSPEFTWEMGADGMMRFYPNVETYPLGWVDWGNDNTGFPDTDFLLATRTHMLCKYNDQRKIAEWVINGRSQGVQKYRGYLDVDLAVNRLRDPGLFQVGWRGGYATPNTEVLQAFIDEIAVYPRWLDHGEGDLHYRFGRKFG